MYKSASDGWSDGRMDGQKDAGVGRKREVEGSRVSGRASLQTPLGCRSLPEPGTIPGGMRGGGTRPRAGQDSSPPCEMNSQTPPQFPHRYPSSAHREPERLQLILFSC